MIFEDSLFSFYYEKFGEKKPVILILPGWGNTRKTFDFIIQYFQKDYTIYILDYPSFGKSPIPKKELTIDDYSLVIQRFLTFFQIQNPIIIAHSFGGRIASLLIGKYHYPTSFCIFFDVAGIRRKKIFSFRTKLYHFFKKLSFLLPKKFQKKYFNFLFLKFSSKDYQNLPISMRKTFQNIISTDLRKFYQNIPSEVLLIWGEKDRDTPLQDAYLLKKMIPNASLICYKGKGHFSYLEDPYLTLNILSILLKNK